MFRIVLALNSMKMKIWISTCIFCPCKDRRWKNHEEILSLLTRTKIIGLRETCFLHDYFIFYFCLDKICMLTSIFLSTFIEFSGLIVQVELILDIKRTLKMQSMIGLYQWLKKKQKETKKQRASSKPIYVTQTYICSC